LAARIEDKESLAYIMEAPQVWGKRWQEKEFVGYLSSHDLWKGLKTISSDDTADALVEHSP
jgi:hypothetical protein